MNKRASAFTLFELLIVIAFIGVLAAMAMPRLMRKSPETSWPHVLDEMNNLVSFARQEAISTQKTYRLAFSQGQEKQDTIIVETETVDPENPDKKIFAPAFSYYYTPRFALPESITIDSVMLGKENLLESGKKRIGHCYVIPHGLVQEVEVHLKRKEEEGAISRATFKMAPFLGTFTFEEKTTQ